MGIAFTRGAGLPDARRGTTRFDLPGHTLAFSGVGESRIRHEAGLYVVVTACPCGAEVHGRSSPGTLLQAEQLLRKKST